MICTEEAEYAIQILGVGVLQGNTGGWGYCRVILGGRVTPAYMELNEMVRLVC